MKNVNFPYNMIEEIQHGWKGVKYWRHIQDAYGETPLTDDLGGTLLYFIYEELPKDLSKLFIQKYVMGKSYNEIQEELGICDVKKELAKGYEILLPKIVACSEVLYLGLKKNKRSLWDYRTGYYAALDDLRKVVTQKNLSIDAIKKAAGIEDNSEKKVKVFGNAKLNSDINVLGLPNVIHNALRRNGINTVSELVSLSRQDINNINGIGCYYTVKIIKSIDEYLGCTPKGWEKP